MINNEFDRAKIYEKLAYEPEPENYSGKIPWSIQQQIAATNGIHYFGEIGILDELPIPDIPVKNAVTKDQLMLDIGCGWGRWLLAASKRNYIPIGIDLRLEFCQLSQQIMHQNGVNGYVVVADLKNLPFIDNIFDLVWSFSVIQHTHKERMLSCLNHIFRILKPNGQTKLEFPNKNGIRNRFGPVRSSMKNAYDYNSWCVRYYSIKEYREIFNKIFGNFQFQNHSFLGIGVLPSDLKYIKRLKNKLGVAVSLMLSFTTRLIPGMKYFSDSVYISATKNESINIRASLKT